MKRALAVLSVTAIATLICWLSFGQAAGWAALIGFAATGTIATIPSDLEPGEYDLFGLGVLAVMLTLGILAAIFDAKPKVRYTSDMDICGDAGCADER